MFMEVDMKRVLQSVSIMNRGGQETLWMNVFRKIDRSELVFDFLVSAKEKGDYDDEIENLGGKVIYVGDGKYNGKISKYYGQVKRVRDFFKNHPEYDTYHINTCHAFTSIFSVIGARMAGVSRIIVHSHNTNAVHPKLHKLAKPFLNMLRFDAMACSEDAGVWMFGKRKVKRGKVRIVKNGIDTDIYKFDESIRKQKRLELGIDDDTVVIGHIGRFNFQKNHSFLIDIFEKVYKKCPNSKLLLVGRGELEEEIRTKVEQLGLSQNVIFLGIRSDVNELLMAMDVFLFPSLFEGLGIVLIEAQAGGVMSVCSSTIPEEAILTKDVVRVSLDDSADKWADTVIRHMDHTKNPDIDSIIKAGYDIHHTASELEKYYLQE